MIQLDYGVPMVTRAEWDARAPDSTTRLGATLITSHWEGPHMGSFPHSSCATKVRGIQAFHMDSRGWTDIAYNMLACPHGYAFEGRGRLARSAANGTTLGNSSAYACCYLGGVDDPFTDGGERAMKAAGNFLAFAGSGRNCHRDWKSTECPGNTICAWTKAGQPISISPQPPQEDTLSAAEVADIKAYITAEANRVIAQVHDSRPFFAQDYSRPDDVVWVVYKDNGTKRWVPQPGDTPEEQEFPGEALALDRVVSDGFWPNGYPRAWTRTKAHLDLYETVGPVPPGWEAAPVPPA